MKERPILFSDAMVRAILAGTKTQTRRVVALPCKRGILGADGWRPFDPTDAGDRVSMVASAPYGAPGDRLWVRECFALSQRDPEDAEVSVREPQWWDPPIYRADGDQGGEWTNAAGQPIPPPWQPSIHMPRWASRLTLEITSVRVERVQSISEDDALAEGIIPLGRIAPIGAFCDLWDSINGERAGCSWEANPWVWVVGFRRIEAP